MIHQCAVFLVDWKLWTFRLEPVACVPSDRAVRVPPIDLMYYPPPNESLAFEIRVGWSSSSRELLEWVGRFPGHPDRPAMFRVYGEPSAGKEGFPPVVSVCEMGVRDGVWLPRRKDG